jgi:hypothetical protein
MQRNEDSFLTKVLASQVALPVYQQVPNTVYLIFCKVAQLKMVLDNV